MIIYSKELELKDQIEAKTTASITTSISLSKNQEENQIIFLNSLNTKFNNEKVQRSIAKIIDNPNPSLLYCSAILCSTVMNKNDDILLPNEMWAAKDTIRQTPVDQEHEFLDIIGHTFDSRVLTKDGAIYTGDTVPDYFDIESFFVIYKDLYPSVADDIIEKYKDNEAYVSMEAIMSSFDYGLVDSQGNFKIVQRTEATSFLTKLLRIYGGSGTYGNYRVGRVLRNFYFSGMGNVKTPANPKSKYTDIQASCITNSDINILSKFLLHSEGIIMVIDTVEQAKEVIANLEKEVAELKTKSKTLVESTEITKQVEAAKVEAKVQIEAKDKAIAELNDKLSGEASKLEIANKELAETKVSIATLNKTLEEKTTANDYMNKALDEYKKASKKSDRSKAMLEAGATLTEDESTKLVTLSDETFAEVLAYTKVILSKKDDKKDKKDEEGDSGDDDKKKKEKDDEDAAAAVLDKAKEEETKAAQAANLLANQETKENELKTVATELVSVFRKLNSNKNLKNVKNVKK